jgi:hypothetical protein
MNVTFIPGMLRREAHVHAVIRAARENPGIARKPGGRQHDDRVHPGERGGVSPERPADRQLRLPRVGST